MTDSLYLAAFVLTCIAAIYRILRIGHRESYLPPGPPTKPIIGNLNILPTSNTYLKFTEWAKEYGGIYSLKVASKTVIVVSSFDAMFQILEKNGSITADRPNRAHLMRIFGQNGVMTQLQYGPVFRRLRRVANDIFKPSACEQHAPIELAEINQLMVDFLNRPENFYDDIKRAVMSIYFSTIFGFRAPSLETPEAKRLSEVSDGIHKIGAPGQVPPIDLLPILYYLPDRFANNWKARSDELNQINGNLLEELLEKAENRVAAGLSNGSFVEKLIERNKEYDLDRRTMRNMGGNFLGAASHSTCSTIQWIVHLATVYDDTQKKAQDEVDRVVGPDRLPTLEDIPNLPYIRAFIQEVLRFRTVVPLAVPHRASEDQYYNGYLIPKGANVFVNAWGILHDPSNFDDPNSFNPDRFVDPHPSKRDMWKKLENLPFGVGRRICPGMHLANQTLELAAASLIWGFEFKPHPDGKPDVMNFTSNTTTDPRPFKCDIKPRSSSKAELMHQNLELSQVVFERFELRKV